MPRNQIDSSQYSLPGIEPPALDNYFLAVQPDTEASQRIVRFTRSLCVRQQLRGRPFDAWRLHVSLISIGQRFVSQQAVFDYVDRTVSTLTMRTFAAAFDRVVSFAGKPGDDVRHPVVLVGNESTEGLQYLFRSLATAFGMRGETMPFTPHMTLLYAMRSAVEEVIEPIGWTVQEFVLIRSHVGQRRPYTVLGRWPLKEERA